MSRTRLIDKNRYASMIPPELKIDVKKELMSTENVNLLDIVNRWFSNPVPTIGRKEDCQDVLSQTTLWYDQEMKQETHLAVKLCLVSYCLPFFMTMVAESFRLPNHHFLRRLESFISQSTFEAYEDMDDIVENDVMVHVTPHATHLGGFYIRTPIQIFDKNGKSVYKLPSWQKKRDLLKFLVVGNVNCYVLRQNLDGKQFELYVTFRGTTNEMNGTQQYGEHLQNTQIYRKPEYDPIENKFYKGGHDSKALYYYYYCSMIDNVKAHIYQCLSWLGVDSKHCKKVVVAGHSMGGAMSYTFSPILKHDHPTWWKKSYFRSIGAPMCSNDYAVRQQEQWFIDSRQPNKHIELINTDDFVNIQHMFAGDKGLQQSIQQGKVTLGSWLMSSYENVHGKYDPNVEDYKNSVTKNLLDHVDGIADKETNDFLKRLLRLAQMYPDMVVASFFSGAMEAQMNNTVPKDDKAPTRVGRRSSEVPLWGTYELGSTYNKTVRLIYCQRRKSWQHEYLSKSHTSYMGINFNTTWASCRNYEKAAYRMYKQKGLKQNNKLQIVGFFRNEDAEKGPKWIKKYKTKTYKPPLLKHLQYVINVQTRLKTVKPEKNRKKHDAKQ